MLTKIEGKLSTIGKKQFLEIFSLVALCFLTAVMLFNPAKDLGDVFYVWLIVICVFLVIAYSCKFHIFDLYARAGLKNYILAGIFTILFLLMSPISEVIKLGCLRFADKTVLRSILVPLNWAFFLLAFAALYGCVLFVLRHAEKSSEQCEEGNVCSRKTFWVCLAVIGGVSFACAFAGYPAIMTSDGFDIWKSNSDWHTTGYVLFTKLCFAVWYTPFSVVLAQSLFWIFVNGFVLDTLYREKGSTACAVYLVLSLTIGHGFYKYLCTLYKDVMFTASFMGYVAALYRLQKRASIGNFCFVGGFSVLTSVFRHGAVFIVAIGLLVPCIIYLAKRKRKLFIRCVACCIAPVVVAVGTIQLYINLGGVEKNPSYVTYTVPLYMLGVYAASGFELSAETVETMEAIMPLEEWIQGYEQDHYYADTVSRKWGVVGDRIEKFDELGLQGAVIKANAEFFFKHPFKYVQCLFDINSLVWEMSRPEGTYPETIIASFSYGDPQISEMYPQWYPAPENGFRVILDPIFDKVSLGVPVIRIIAYRGGLHIWWMLLLAAYALKKDKQLAALTIPVIVMALMLLVSLPAQHSRYIFPFVLFTTFFTPVCFCKVKKQDGLCLDKSF